MARTVPTSQATLATSEKRSEHVRVIVSDQGQNLFGAGIGADDIGAGGFTAVSGGSLATDTGGIRGNECVEITTTNTGDGAYAEATGLTASTLYTASFYAKAAAGTYPVIEAYLRDQTNGTNGTTRTVYLRPDRWTRIVVQHTMGAGTPTARLYMLQPSSGAASVFLAHRFKLEARGYASRWTPFATGTTTTDHEVDLTDHDGRDWLLAVEGLQSGIDQPTGAVAVKVFRDIDERSLSPRSGSSAATHTATGLPILRRGQHLRIEVQLGADGEGPDPNGDWTEVFDGRIDDLDWGDFTENVVTLKCRDRSGQDLQDVFIREEQPEPVKNPGGVTISSWYKNGITWPIDSDDFLQAVLDGTAGAGQWPLVIDGTPVAGLNEPDATNAWVKKEPVLGCVRRIAQACGGDVRFAWDSSNSRFALKYVIPDTSSPSSSWSFNDDFLMSVRPVESIIDVRTEARVWYTNSSGYRYFSDSASTQTGYDLDGDRWCEVSEASTGSVIDSSSEATALADRIIEDLEGVDSNGDPLYNRPWTVKMPLHVWIEPGDVITLNSTRAPLYAVTYAQVATVSHDWSDGKGETTLQVVEIDTGHHGVGQILAGIWPRLAQPGVAPGASVTIDPKSVRLRAELSSGQAVSSATSSTKVQFNSVTLDRTGSWDASTNYNFTAPFDGLYRVNASVTVTDIDAAGEEFLIAVRLATTGKAWSSATVISGKTGGTILTVSADVLATEGQAIDLLFENDPGGTDSVTLAAGSWITIERIR